MKTAKKMLAIVAPILLLALLTSSVSARGGVFVVPPTQSVVQSLPSLNTDESVAGIFSATGPIDFYVLGPSGTLLLFYNQTEFSDFKFYPDVKGICTICMVNCEPTNVTVNLTYGINFVVNLYETVDLSFSTHTTLQPVQPPPQTITIPPLSHITTPPSLIPKILMPRLTMPQLTIPALPFDWSDIVDLMKNNISTILGILASVIGSIITWIIHLPSRIRWWFKHRKNRTPSTILDSPLVDGLS
jgi:hypothetical protein